LDDSRGVAHASEYLGVVYMFQGKYKLAEELIKKALSEHNRRGEWRCQRHANFHLGLLAKKQGNFLVARKYYLKSFHIAVKLNYFYIKAETLLRLCFLELQAKNVQQARQYYSQFKEYFGHKRFSTRSRLSSLILQVLQDEDDLDWKSILKLFFNI